MPKKYTAIRYFNKCIRAQRLLHSTLCSSPVADYAEYRLVTPTFSERTRMRVHIIAWGSENSLDRQRYVFTPLRQNIVLLIAAMNNEL